MLPGVTTMRHSINMALIVGLVGCSDNLAPALEDCKAKATEAQVSAQQRTGYVRECMHAQGWPIKDACLNFPDRWDISECYLR